jgi:hypothetical protein
LADLSISKIRHKPEIEIFVDCAFDDRTYRPQDESINRRSWLIPKEKSAIHLKIAAKFDNEIAIGRRE